MCYTETRGMGSPSPPSSLPHKFQKSTLISHGRTKAKPAPEPHLTSDSILLSSPPHNASFPHPLSTSSYPKPNKTDGQDLPSSSHSSLSYDPLSAIPFAHSLEWSSATARILAHTSSPNSPTSPSSPSSLSSLSSFSPSIPSPPSPLSLRYRLGPTVGSGVTAVVCAAIALGSSSMYACKSVKKRGMRCPRDITRIRMELSTMRAASGHVGVVELREALEDEEAVHIIMELCEGGDLFDQIQKRDRLYEEEAAHVCEELLSILQHCHSQGIVHRDLKPENILLTSKESCTRVKLADFGQAAFFQRGQKLTERVGTQFYMAPEVIDGHYGPECDVWSLGAVLFVLLSGSPPFGGNTLSEIFNDIKEGEIDTERGSWTVISGEAKDLVRRMLCRDPTRRITPLEARVHPWIRRHCRVRPLKVPRPLTESRVILRKDKRDSSQPPPSRFQSPPMQLPPLFQSKIYTSADLLTRGIK